MNQKIKILHLEDLSSDAYLVERELKKGKFPFQTKVVYNKHNYIEALTEFKPDIVLSDHSLPSFNSAEALTILKQQQINIPFILVTGNVSEEFAAAMIKAGAWDYILKDRMQRLPNAILGAIEKFQLQQNKQRHIKDIIASEQLFKHAERIAKFGIWKFDVFTGDSTWSEQTYCLLGYAPFKAAPSYKNFLRNIIPEDIYKINCAVRKAFIKPDNTDIDFRIVQNDQSICYVRSTFIVEKNEEHVPVCITGFIQDITATKLAEIEKEKNNSMLEQRNKDLEQFNFIVSHNLRAPLTNIIGLVDLLKGLEDGQVLMHWKQVLPMIDNSSLKLDQVIKDLNTILALKNNLKDAVEHIDLYLLIDDIKEFLPSSYSEQAHFVCNFDEAPFISAIRVYLHSILLNLITNSVKYKQDDLSLKIEITSSFYQNKVRVVFKDNGSGIDLKNRSAEVFKLYSRFHLHKEGSGTGLFMVKTQVELMGGKIGISSEVNHGTTFTIDLPQHFRKVG